ncbi:hypothetical protein RUM43_009442 [Polyplax serrata]|uniref:Uncharacterized protein n=1 Tax=Polyplax serrata TaxID=468196 RepID=A0AAN8NPJ6_POLSC
MNISGNKSREPNIFQLVRGGVDDGGGGAAAADADAGGGGGGVCQVRQLSGRDEKKRKNGKGKTLREA